MAISLDSIHQPLNDFFLNHFKFDAQSPMLFRFDKFGSIISDQDFIDPKNPETPSPNLALEKFSDLVNRIPIEEADGLNTFISQAQIDQAYLGLLNRAIPFVPEGSDAQTGESIITSFSLIKSEALKLWANIKLESSTGLMFDFKPALAGPKDWYDRKNKDNWTSHSFKVTEPAGAASPASAKSVSWVKKIDDVEMAKIVPLTESDRPVKPTQLAAVLLEAHPNRPVLTTPKMVNASLRPGGTSVRSSARVATAGRQPRKEVRGRGANKAPVVRDHRGKQNVPVVRDHRGKPGKDTAGFALQNRWLSNVRRMNLKDRIAVSQYITQNAPTAPATTNSISIAFDYCLVNISRPWYRSQFINDPSWCIPNTTKGQFTARASSGANLTLMPVGVVAIKNLNIQAHWSAADIAQSKDATSFGPFKVEGMVNDALTHSGIQIIGWLFERMPELPPNSSPKPKQG